MRAGRLSHIAILTDTQRLDNVRELLYCRHTGFQQTY